MARESRAEGPTFFVRAVPNGFAVFSEHGEKRSEVFEHQQSAIDEARTYGGIVLVESETGHIVGEVV